MATQFAVDLVFKSQGGRKIRDLSNQLQGLEGSSKKAQRGITGVGTASKRAAGGVNALQAAALKLGAAFSAIQAAKFVFFKTAELETQTRSLQVLTGSLKEAQSVISELQNFAAVTPFTSTELVETAKRLKAFGVDTEKLVDTTKRLGDVAGATGAKLDGIATAYGQIQAKGRLQGEELLQLQERGINLQDELQKMYGLTGDEFRKALEKGRFSAEAVELALERLTSAGGKYANGAIAQSDTLAGKMSTLQDGIDNLARTLGNVLSPALKIILNEAIGVVNSINAALAAGRRIQQFGIGAQQRNQLFQQAGEEAKQLALLRGGGKLDPAEFTRLRQERFKDLIEKFGYESGQIEVEIKPVLAEGATKIPELLGATSPGGKKKKGGKTEAEKAAERLKRLAEEGAKAWQGVSQRIVEGNMSLQQRVMDQQRLNALLAQGETPEKAQQIVQREREKADLLAKRVSDLAEVAKLEGLTASEIEQRQGAINALYDDRLAKLNALNQATDLTNEKLKEQQAIQRELNFQQEQMNGLVNGIGQQFSSLFDTLITDTNNWRQALTGALKQLSSMLLKFGFSMLGGSDGKGLFSILSGNFGGARAAGGPVSTGKSYLVGENGPEMFTPGRSGMIHPNGAGGEVNSVVNITITDSGTQVDTKKATELGRLVETTVVGVLQRERRPGGMLSR